MAAKGKITNYGPDKHNNNTKGVGPLQYQNSGSETVGRANTRSTSDAEANSGPNKHAINTKSVGPIPYTNAGVNTLGGAKRGPDSQAGNIDARSRANDFKSGPAINPEHPAMGVLADSLHPVSRNTNQ
jgi:hypothetical protein